MAFTFSAPNRLITYLFIVHVSVLCAIKVLCRWTLNETRCTHIFLGNHNQIQGRCLFTNVHRATNSGRHIILIDLCCVGGHHRNHLEVCRPLVMSYLHTVGVSIFIRSIWGFFSCIFFRVRLIVVRVDSSWLDQLSNHNKTPSVVRKNDVHSSKLASRISNL